METGRSQERLTAGDAQTLAEQDALTAAADRAATLELLDGAEELIAEIDELLVERPFLLAFRQWAGE